MKYISRLTALLLAMMMLLSSTVLAEGGIGVPDLKEDWLEQQYTIASYGQCGNDNKYCVQIDEIRGKTYAEIEDYLKYSIDDSALVEMLLGHHYYYHYLKGKDTELLCICGHHAHEIGEDNIGTELYFPYGDEKHLEDCPWGKSSSVLKLTMVDGAYVLSVTGANGETVIIAKSVQLEGSDYYYFQDVKTSLNVAYLHIDEDGTQWIIPLKSEKQSNEENPAN